MQYLLEYSDTLNSPYEAFMCSQNNTVFPIRAHWHYFMEVIYMLEGTGIFECGGKRYTAEAGDLVIFYPEEVHAIYTSSSTPLRYAAMKFDINKIRTGNNFSSQLRSVLQSARRTEEISILVPEEKLREYNIKEIFDTCIFEVNDKSYGYDVVVHNQICALLILLIRIWKKDGFDIDLKPSQEVEVFSLQHITAYIDEHIGDVLRVEDLALRCNMSYSYFAKSFKDYYGRSCKEYIEFVRVSRAEDLLMFTDYDLNFISQETGFSDSSHLIKTFKKWKGTTPKQFKLTNKK